MIKEVLVNFSVKHYKLVLILTIIVALLGLSQFPFIKIDTDPENMLSKDEFIRVFDRQVRDEFNLNDIIVLGIVDEVHPNGVFTKETLNKIYKITEKIKDIEITFNNEKINPVISRQIISPSTVDDIRQGASVGNIIFQWLMPNLIETEEEALEIQKQAKDNPFLHGTMVSENGKAISLYIPIREKEYSYLVSQEIQKIVDSLPHGNEKYYITGLPVAEDTFGYEMFKQMAISAPVAGLIIFLLMWFFFKNIKLIISPMIVAVVSILFAMGLLIAMGFTVHIMSSMIAIFLMPIAVVDSVHIISDFFEKYQLYKDREKTIKVVMGELFTPMLYTSLTSTVGFVSLATAPIPPVQIFGIFVGLGIMMAWFLTMTFLPASVMLISEKTLANFGANVKKSLNSKSESTNEIKNQNPVKLNAHSVAEKNASKISQNVEDNNIKNYRNDNKENQDNITSENFSESNNNDIENSVEVYKNKTILKVILEHSANFVYRHAKIVITATVLLTILSVIGILKININDNPVKWFSPKHDIRIADEVLNQHFSGTYLAHLIFEDTHSKDQLSDYMKKMTERLNTFLNDFGVSQQKQQVIISDFNSIYSDFVNSVESSKSGTDNSVEYKIADLQKLFVNKINDYNHVDEYFVEDFSYFLDDEAVRAELFKQPEVLRYIEDLQNFMETTHVGKSNSLVTIIRKVYMELMGGSDEFNVIPPTANAIGESLIQFQSSHRPDDLYHFVTPDFSKLNIWVQLQSGDNQIMTEVEELVDEYLKLNKADFDFNYNWAGKTYINVVWQDKMVKGMLENALLASYIVVLIMMILLFKSIWWGMLSMIPLTVTITFIYGFIGFIGKDYDMPVAVLSSLTLGLAVDFSIHFLQRFREILAEENGNLKVAILKMFDEPASAISRNIIVIALGFLPLLLSPLVPYQTVGFFLSAIMFVSGIGTLIILPAILKDLISDFSET